MAESKAKNKLTTDWAAVYKHPNVMALKMQALQKSDNGELLPLAVIKGKGYGNYYSVVDKKPINVPRKAQYFILPWAHGDDDSFYYLYSHGIAISGLILRVPKEEVQILGFN